MGMYTGIRFKGIVKEEFRNEFEDIALDGNWDISNNKIFRQFGNVSRANFIPCGVLFYMPVEWETVNKNGFDRAYDKDTGRWTFQCSLKNYDYTIEHFFKIVPYFIEKIEHAEVYYEEWSHSVKLELIDGKIIMTNNKFIKYECDSDNYYRL